MPTNVVVVPPSPRLQTLSHQENAKGLAELLRHLPIYSSPSDALHQLCSGPESCRSPGVSARTTRNHFTHTGFRLTLPFSRAPSPIELSGGSRSLSHWTISAGLPFRPPRPFTYTPTPVQGHTPRRLHGRPRHINALLRLVADDLLSKAKSFPSRHTYLSESFLDKTRITFAAAENRLIRGVVPGPRCSL